MRFPLLFAAAILVGSPASAIERFSYGDDLPFEAGSFSAPLKIQTGSRGGLSWTAMSRIVGQTPTADAANTGGGNIIYKPTAQKSGTVALIMDRGAGGLSICSGSLLGDRRSIATAAHCVSDGFGTANPISTTAFFFNGDPDARTVTSSSVSVDVGDYFIHPDYTGEVIDQNDIAILRLSDRAPGTALSYGLYTDPIVNGTQFNVAGYGGRSTVGGTEGRNANTGFLREGDNIYDFTLDDAAFSGFFTDLEDGTNFFGTTADVAFSYLSDFDNGLADNDAAGLLGQNLGTSDFLDTGLGEREVNIAGGDSGGPGFINGRLATLNSFGLSFGTGLGDFTEGLDSSFGEFAGYVPVFIHTDFILMNMVPEPGTWAMLIAGFGLTGAAMRRRRLLARTLTTSRA